MAVVAAAVAAIGLRALDAILEVFLGLSWATFRVSIGLRLRVRALESSGLSSSSISSSTGSGVASLLLAADRVIGPLYPSCSDGVGLGDMTRGVDGMACFVRPDMS